VAHTNLLRCCPNKLEMSPGSWLTLWMDSRIMSPFVPCAPILHGPMMTCDDVQFAHKMNKAEIEDYTEEIM
jgi:hypothetical protein